jgi:hypothetical protein
METIEIIIYFFVAFVIGLSIILYIKTGGFTVMYDDLRGIDSEKSEFKKVNNVTVVEEVVNFWQNCGYGEIDKTLILYIGGKGEFNKTTFFSTISKINYCDTLQSASENCGIKEDVIFEKVITLPKVARFFCNSTNKKLIVS